MKRNGAPENPHIACFPEIFKERLFHMCLKKQNVERHDFIPHLGSLTT